MKRFGKMLLFVLTILFLQVNVVNAASKCDYNEQVELNNLAADIKVTYEEAEGEIDPSLIIGASGATEPATYYYFKVLIYNLPDNLYLKITNDVNDEVKYLHYSNAKDGVIEFDWEDLNKVANFTITVYSSANSSCPNEEYRVIYLTLPRYNEYSARAKCTDKESFYYCQKYITTEEEIDEKTFEEKLLAFESEEIIKHEQEEEANKNWIDRFIDTIKENKITVGIASTIIVIGGVVAIVIVIKKRRSRLI